MGAQPSPSSAWDDVGPRKDYRRHVKNWRRRQPLRALDDGAKNTDTPIVHSSGGNLPSPCGNDVNYIVCVPSDGTTKPLEYGQVRGNTWLESLSGACCGLRGLWLARNTSAPLLLARPVYIGQSAWIIIPLNMLFRCVLVLVKFFAFPLNPICTKI